MPRYPRSRRTEDTASANVHERNEQRHSSALLTNAQAGDRRAKEQLLVETAPRIKSWLHGRLPRAARGHQDTDDLAQEALLHALRRIDVFDPRHSGAVPAYLFRSAVNRARDEARRANRRPQVVELDEQTPSATLDPLTSALRGEARRQLRAALSSLRQKDRQLLLARVEGPCRLAEVARKAGLRSEAAAGMAIGRARRKLRQRLAH